MQIMTIDRAPVQERDDGGPIGRVIVRDFFGKGHQLTAGPQVYFGEQLYPGSEIYAHFHDVDQFQVVVKGSGRFGRVPVGSVTLQYADAFAPYGPIVAGAEGLGFFVFRRRAASGGWRMPGHAAMIPKPIGRRFFVQVEDLDARPGAGEVVHESHRQDADGLGVEVVRLGAGAETSIGPDGCGGYHLLVCRGAIEPEGNDEPLVANSVLLPDADEPPPIIRACADGAIVLVMRFPRATSRPGSDVNEFRAGDGAYVRAANAS
jgi:hypothetical protein